MSLRSLSTDDDTVFMKDAEGRIIGLEKLNVVLAPGDRGATVEVANVTAPAG